MSEILEKAQLADWLTVIIILILTFILASITRRVMNRFINLASERLKTDPTRYKFLKHFLTSAIIILGLGLAIYTIPSLRSLAISMFAGAGILAVVVGFASQAAFSNIVSGIFIVIFKPFRIGDRITVGTHSGTIEDITLRHTVIRNWENRMVIIPNSVISNETVVNSSILDERICNFFEIGISYDSDVEKALQIMAEEAEKHPFLRDNRSPEEIENNAPKVVTRVMGFGESSVNLRAWLWADNVGNAFIMSKDLNKTVKSRFDQEGIEIPFPHRTLVFKNQAPKQ